MRIVITGLSSGIGRALAERLLTGAHAVWGLARSDQTEFPNAHPDRFFATRCDVAGWTQVESASRVVRSVWPTLDALITCAGQQGEVGRALSVDPISWSDIVRTNLDGTFLAMRAFVSAATKNPSISGGQEVTCSSMDLLPHFR